MTANVLRIHWIVDGVRGDGPQHWSSPLASNRYRAILPARELIRQGHEVRLLPAESWRIDAHAVPDAIVIGKLLPSGDPTRFGRLSASVLAQLGVASEQGIPSLADFNDDHFAHPQLGEHWRTLAAAVDLCVVGSEGMAQRVRNFTPSPARVVGDPLGSPSGAARVYTRGPGIARLAQSLMPGRPAPQRLKFVWYGNPVNWPAMQDWAEKLAPLASRQPFVMWVVCAEVPAIERYAEEFNRRHGPHAAMQFIGWEESTQWSVVADADIVLIPSDPADPKKAVKTSNRLADALNAGRYVIASPLPAYAPFSASVSLTDAPLAAVAAYLDHPARSLSMIQDGQALARSLAGERAIAEAWCGAVVEAIRQRAEHGESVREQRRPAAPTVPATPTSDRLHMRSSLEQIHRTKASKVSDKWQSYFAFYERNFAAMRGSPISLFEIGVQNGGSMEVWAKYFASATALVGCDIDKRCEQLKYDDPRISIVVGDANQDDVAARIFAICPAFDIVIDDGSHVSDDIVHSFLRYFPKVKPGGVYVVEDTHTMYRESHQGGILRKTTAHEFFKLMVDLVNREHWEGDLSIKTLFSTFALPDRLLTVLQEGWVDAIEFRNSLVCVHKSRVPTHNKLGERVVSGVEAIVHPAVLRFQARVEGSTPHMPVSGGEDESAREPVPVQAKQHRAPAPSGTGVRLNLGCGDKILPGYVNVDVVEARAGRKPDVICDLHALTPFHSNHADEVMAIHVVEHFWRWEIEDVLKEWIRVLKPGGRLILECPNLQSACEAFLADPELRSQTDQAGQTTMWVFYGDPQWRDPLMVHRWGYTPASLGRLMRGVGLVDVRQEAAQYKLREPRDMRMVGVKPG